MARTLMTKLVMAALVVIPLGLIACEVQVRNLESEYAKDFIEVGKTIVQQRFTQRETLKFLRERVSGTKIVVGSDSSVLTHSDLLRDPPAAEVDYITNVSFGVELPRGLQFWPRTVLGSVTFKDGRANSWTISGIGPNDYSAPAYSGQ